MWKFRSMAIISSSKQLTRPSALFNATIINFYWIIANIKLFILFIKFNFNNKLIDFDLYVDDEK